MPNEIQQLNIGDCEIERQREQKRAHVTIALAIMTIAGGGLFKLPPIPEDAFYKVMLYKAYPLFTLASFSLALISVLMSSGMLPNAHKFGASIALKLIWVALAMELLALLIATSLVFLIG